LIRLMNLLESSKGPLVLEVNASPGLEGIEKTTGKDVALEIILYAESKAGLRKIKDLSKCTNLAE